MSWLASRLRQHLCRRGRVDVRGRRISNSTNGGDEAHMDEDVEKEFGFVVKIIFAATASFAAYHFFPFMGETLLQQTIALIRVKDPLFKRMGASRLSRFAVDDERRMKVVELGGAHELLKMLEAAKDDRTRKFALKALVTLANSEKAAGILHGAGAIPIISSTPNSKEYPEIEGFKSNLLRRFQDLKHDVPNLQENDLSY